MTNKKPKLAFLFILGVIVSFMAMSCNNSSNSEKKDSDTTKMDTATTRPVKTTD